MSILVNYQAGTGTSDTRIVNTGTVNITVANPDLSTCAYNLTPANNTFSNTCPILVNYQAGTGTADTGIVKTGTNAIVAGLYIARPPTTSFAGINLALSAVQHPLTNRRLYYSQVTVDPQKSIDYVQRNRNKKVIYRSLVTNSYPILEIFNGNRHSILALLLCLHFLSLIFKLV